MTSIDRPGVDSIQDPDNQPPSSGQPLVFLFTDIVGSTRMWEDAASAMEIALERHDEIVNRAIDRRNGEVFATGGDGVAAVFVNVDDAVAASVEAQAELADEKWPDEAPIRVRMGLHAGSPQRRGGDYFGPPVNRAARVMSIAGGGQIVVTSQVVALVAGDGAEAFVDLGHHELKGLREPLQLFGLDTPSHRWDGEAIALGRAAVAARLPVPVSEWFGPVSALSAMAKELTAHRLLSIVGPGGTGKTRTSLELSQRAADHYPDGVWLVELLAVGEADAVAPAVAAALGVRPQLGLSITESIVEWLAARRALVIVDNCEHVIDAAAEVVRQIVTRCPTTTVLATTRERLGIAGEQVMAPPALELEHATALFRERATALDSSIDFSEVDDELIATICRRLDLIPLAVEIAAARLRMMSVTELEAGLRDRFRLMRGAGRGIPAHHRTLHGAIDWSYQLLAPEERVAFQRLSVFAGWFDLEGAEVIIDDAEADVLDVLPALVDKSMVVADRGRTATRFRLLETLREFGADRLAEDGDQAAVRERHRDHVVSSAERAGRQWLSSDQLAADAVYDALWDDLRAVHLRACQTGDIESAERLIKASFNHALLRVRSEHGSWAAKTLELHRPDRPVDTEVFALSAWWAMLGGNVDQALEQAALGRDSARTSISGAALCDGVAGFTLWSTRRVDEAVEPLDRVRHALGQVDEWTELMLHRALTGLVAGETRELAARMASVAESIGAPALVASARFYQGLGASAAPTDFKAAIELHTSGVRLARSSGAYLAECQNLSGLQATAGAVRHPDAVRLCRDALRRIHALGFWLHLWPVLTSAARHLVRAEDIEGSATVCGFLEANRFGWGDPDTRQMRETTLESVKRHPDGEALLAEGATLDRETVVQVALDGLARLIDEASAG